MKEDQSADYKSYRDKAVNDALSKVKFKPKPLTREEALMDRAKQVTISVRQALKPILQAGGAEDRMALLAMAHQFYLEAFNIGFSKEELAVICTIIHVEVMMDVIDANPWGGDKPDQLSGV